MSFQLPEKVRTAHESASAVLAERDTIAKQITEATARIAKAQGERGAAFVHLSEAEASDAIESGRTRKSDSAFRAFQCLDEKSVRLQALVSGLRSKQVEMDARIVKAERELAAVHEEFALEQAQKLTADEAGAAQAHVLVSRQNFVKAASLGLNITGYRDFEHTDPITSKTICRVMDYVSVGNGQWQHAFPEPDEATRPFVDAVEPVKNTLKRLGEEARDIKKRKHQAAQALLDASADTRPQTAALPVSPEFIAADEARRQREQAAWPRQEIVGARNGIPGAPVFANMFPTE